MTLPISKGAHILYVEDDTNLAYITQYNLEKSGYQVTHCTDGLQAWETYNSHIFNLCIFDVMLPGMNGFALAEQIRRTNPDIPILFLTVKSLLEDRIAGFQLGADDYMTKPFSYVELELKVKVFLKRPLLQKENSTKIKIHSLLFDVENLLLIHEEEEHKLTLKETELLKFFLDRRNKVLKRDEILLGVWGNDDYFMGRSLDVFISRLRKYLQQENQVKIENIHGVGFKMVVK
jgi:DNA-binding response OmpR family regulator